MVEPSTSGASELVRSKLVQIFRYLREFHQLRNPVQRDITNQPWVMWLADIPNHDTIVRGRVTSGEESPGDDFILKVRRPTLARPPEPPAELIPWLKPGWTSPDTKPEVEVEKTETLHDGSTRTRRFADDPNLGWHLERYVLAHGAWAQTEQPARKAMAVFERLYALQSRLERESERVELMVGDGLLTWKPATVDRINHPFLLQGLELVFNPEIPEFVLRETPQLPELYTALVADVPDVKAKALSRCREDLEQGGWHPLGAEETVSFFRRTISQLDPHGVFIAEGEPITKSQAPYLTRNPVLFLRNRSLGFARALDAILTDLQTRADVPVAFSNIVGIEKPTQGEEEDQPGDPSPNGEDEDVLLSKPANPEQLAIAKQLDRHGAVLVQGPPGTGKTHTIANLLGHLLAQGKSVLVTSHTSKALKVLREQVVEPLQPLCVSVTDDSNAPLESAINGISERLGKSNAEELERQAHRLHQERAALIRRLRTARTQLLHARADEYRAVVVAGTEHDPSAAARRVSTGRGVYDWIPGPLAPSEPLPLSDAEFLELYRSNTIVTAQDERELEATLPNPSTLLSPSDFTALVKGRERLLQTDLQSRSSLWVNSPATQTAEQLETLQTRLVTAVEPIGQREAWRLAAIMAGQAGPAYERTWRDLIEQINQVSTMAADVDLTLMKFGPELPADWSATPVKGVIDAVVAHLEKGGHLNMATLLFRKDWKRLIDSAKVAGNRPSTLEHFTALQSAAAIRIAREQLAQRWQRQMLPLGAPDVTSGGAELERACQQHVPELERCLAWHSGTWTPLAQELERHGLQLDRIISEMPVNLDQHGELLRLHALVTQVLPPILGARINTLRLTHIEAVLAKLYRTLELSPNTAGPASGHLLIAVKDAVRTRDHQAYAAAFGRLVEVWNKQTDLARRRELLRKLEPVASGWAAAIRIREGIHGESQPPGALAEAWLWRQLHEELERRAQVSLEELQRQIAQATDDLHRLTARLVECKAWAAQVRRTSLKQRMALFGWRDLIRRAGKRTGRRAPEFLAQARSLMPDCQSAVPVWIMPLSRVAESFDPARNRFDVVIIDEASQSDMMALIALYFGKQVVIVGDNEQVSPLAIGVDFDQVKQLIGIHLNGVPNQFQYDGQESIYDVAQTSFQPIRLLEHFRCVAPIIQFSNHLSYDGKIKPLRDQSNVLRRPATMAYRVDGATIKGHVNDKEAVTVVSLLISACDQPEYDNATFGVISLLADDQARRIDQLLQRYMDASEYSRRKVRCGNSADFQGDERDVMFLSMVDAPTGRGPLALRREGAGDMYKKRFNVAASRARDQMWVVHSLNPAVDLQGEDIRLRLIKHAENPIAMDMTLKEGVARTESEFEKQVLTRLVQAGYRVVPQWQVGAYRIDMVVTDGNRRLAVECDGDRWHTEENLQQDVLRQAILERMGWRFVRIRGSQFFRNPDTAMHPVFERLRALEILPVGPTGDEPVGTEAADELKQRIIRRAAELRREWGESEETDLTAMVSGESPTATERDNRVAAEAPDKAAGKVQPGREPTLGQKVGAARPNRQAQLVLPLGAVQAELPLARSPIVCRIGCHAVVRDPDGEEFEFQLVPAGKGDLNKGMVSADSPLGRAVKDKVAGETAKVGLPGGGFASYIVLDVRDIGE